MKNLALFIVVIFFITLSSFTHKPKKHYYPNEYKLVASAELCEVCEMKIPKIIHRIWTVWDKSKPEMPEIYKLYDARLKKLHPDWTFMEWNDNNMDDFVKKKYPKFYKTYQSYDMPVKKHDAFRYLVVGHYGGVFIQHSLYIDKNIEPLLRGYDAVFSSQSSKGNSICNGFFAAIKNHEVVKKLINRLDSRTKYDVIQSTGPLFVSYNIHEYIAQHKNVLGSHKLKILPPKYLFPFDWNQKGDEPYFSECIKPALDCKKSSHYSARRCMNLFPEAYGFCLWSASWVPKS